MLVYSSYIFHFVVSFAPFSIRLYGFYSFLILKHVRPGRLNRKKARRAKIQQNYFIYMYIYKHLWISNVFMQQKILYFFNKFSFSYYFTVGKLYKYDMWQFKCVDRKRVTTFVCYKKQKKTNIIQYFLSIWAKQTIFIFCYSILFFFFVFLLFLILFLR